MYRFIVYYCVMFCSHILLYKCYILWLDIFSDLAHLVLFSSSYPSVHIHMVMWNIGDIVHNLSMSIWFDLQRYDIWEVFVVFIKLKWVLYEMLHDVYIDYISICKWVSYFMLFHVICCHVYNIYSTHHVEFLSIYDMCMLCDRRFICQCTCVFVHHYGILYCDIWYLYDISCFWCFNIHLFGAIV